MSQELPQQAFGYPLCTSNHMPAIFRDGKDIFRASCMRTTGKKNYQHKNWTGTTRMRRAYGGGENMANPGMEGTARKTVKKLRTVGTNHQGPWAKGFALEGIMNFGGI